MAEISAPYTRRPHTDAQRAFARTLRDRITPALRRQCPMHYLVQARPDTRLAFIEAQRKTYPAYLRFDIRTFFPAIDHGLLLDEVPRAYAALRGRDFSRPMTAEWDQVVPAFLSTCPPNTGLPIGHPLSHILSGLFVLRLDLSLEQPLVRVVDDYLVLCKSEQQARDIYENVVCPGLDRLGLAPNPAKVATGRFGRDGVVFTGYHFHGGHVGIARAKRASFLARIRRITDLRRNKPVEAVIKQLNNAIDGFGHYYKHTSCKSEFARLDSSIRQRLRRYIARRRRHEDVHALNTQLSQGDLAALGLHSLSAIKANYDKRGVAAKKSKNGGKRGEQSPRHVTQPAKATPATGPLEMRLQAISKQLEAQNKTLRNIEKRLARLEKQWRR